jgi:hypothetical protein
MARKELGCAKKTLHVWEWYNYCVGIRCQDMTREDLACPSDL